MQLCTLLSIVIALASVCHTEAKPFGPPGIYPPTGYQEYSTTTYSSNDGNGVPTTRVEHQETGRPPVSYTMSGPPFPNPYQRRGLHSKGGEGGSDEHPPVFMPDAHSVPNPVENVSTSQIFQAP